MYAFRGHAHTDRCTRSRRTHARTHRRAGGNARRAPDEEGGVSNAAGAAAAAAVVVRFSLIRSADEGERRVASERRVKKRRVDEEEEVVGGGETYGPANKHRLPARWKRSRRAATAVGAEGNRAATPIAREAEKRRGNAA